MCRKGLKMEWYKAESSNRPLEVDTESSKKYNYVRKNIEETQRESDGEATIVFVYDECKVLKEDWGLYLELAQAQADIDYLNMITEDL